MKSVIEQSLPADLIELHRVAVEAKAQPFKKYIELVGLDPEDDLRGFAMEGKRLVGEDFGWLNLDNAQFAAADLTGASFRGAYLVGADFAQANLTGVDLREAVLHRTRFDGATLTGARLWAAVGPGLSLKDAQWSHVFWDPKGQRKAAYGAGWRENSAVTTDVHVTQLETVWKAKRAVAVRDLQTAAVRLRALDPEIRHAAWIFAFRAEAFSAYHRQRNANSLARLYALLASIAYASANDPISSKRLRDLAGEIKAELNDCILAHITVNTTGGESMAVLREFLAQQLAMDSEQLNFIIVNATLGRVELSLTHDRARRLQDAMDQDSSLYKENGIEHLWFSAEGLNYDAIIIALRRALAEPDGIGIFREELSKLPRYIQETEAQTVALLLDAEETGQGQNDKGMSILIRKLHEHLARSGQRSPDFYDLTLKPAKSGIGQPTPLSRGTAGFWRWLAMQSRLIKVSLALLGGLGLATGGGFALTAGIAFGGQIAGTLLSMISPLLFVWLGNSVGRLVGRMAYQYRSDRLAYGAVGVFLLGLNVVQNFIWLTVVEGSSLGGALIGAMLSLIGLLASMDISNLMSLLGMGFGSLRAFHEAR